MDKERLAVPAGARRVTGASGPKVPGRLSPIRLSPTTPGPLRKDRSVIWSSFARPAGSRPAPRGSSGKTGATDDHDQVMAGQGLAYRADGARQRPGKQRMVLGKAPVPGKARARPGLQPFGQGDAFSQALLRPRRRRRHSTGLRLALMVVRKAAVGPVRGCGWRRAEGILVGHFLSQSSRGRDTNTGPVGCCTAMA